MAVTHYRIVGLLLILTLAVIIFTGCGNKEAGKYIRFAVGAEPESLDSRKVVDDVSSKILAQLYEGLTALDEKAVPVPAAAEKWEISPDGLKYTFYLRPEAKWSNGEPVTASDFEYAWKTELSPDFASRNAYMLFCLKNGEAYNNGQASADDVGVKAVAPYILEVTLEQPAPYFLALMAHHAYYPVHRATVEKNGSWASAPQTIISNGPFRIVKWVHSSKIELVKNGQYWDAAKVKMLRLDILLIENANTEVVMFDSNQIDIGRSPPSAVIPKMLKEGTLKIYPHLATYYYVFNVTRPPFDNPKVRQAFNLALDRRAIIKNVAKGEQQPALAFVPPGLADAESGVEFRQTGGDYFKDNDVEAARKLLAEAGYPGGRGLPPVTLIYNTSEGHKAIAEAAQEMWKKNLGVDVMLTNQEWKVFISTRNKGDFQIARDGWVGDYPDPMTFIDLFTTDSGNNDAQYRKAEYDKLVALAKNSADQAARMQTMHQAEKLLMDDAVVAPVYFYTDLIYAKSYVKGLRVTILGTIYFKEAYIE